MRDASPGVRLEGALDRLISASPLILIALALIAAVARLYFGVDFTDEAYYATIPYRFVVGDIPYVDELNVRQNAGLVTTPAVALWVGITGDADGLMLFLRYLYLLVRVALLVLAVRALWNRAPRALTLTVSALLCAYILFGIPALSYNTVAGSAATASLLCALLWFERGRSLQAAASISLALLAAFSHPATTLVMLAVCAAVIRLSPTPETRARAQRICAVIFVATAIVFAVVAFQLGAENIRRLASEAGWYTGPAATLRSFIRVPGQMLLRRAGWLLGALWVALWFIGKLPPRQRLALFVAYTILALVPTNEVAFVWLAVGSLPLAFSVWRSTPEAREREHFVVATLSTAAGISIALFSTNGVSNASACAEVAVMLFFVCGHRRTADAFDAATPRLSRVIVIGLAALAVVRFSAAQWRGVYRDDHVFRLTRVVPDGPFKGLRTTPTKLEFLEGVQSALRAHAAGHASLLAFNGFPAAHLMVPLRVALPVSWVPDYPMDYARAMRQAMAREVLRAPKPMLVLQLFRLPTTQSTGDTWDYSGADPLISALRAEGLRELWHNADFALYHVGPGTSNAARSIPH